MKQRLTLALHNRPLRIASGHCVNTIFDLIRASVAIPYLNSHLKPSENVENSGLGESITSQSAVTARFLVKP